MNEYLHLITFHKKLLSFRSKCNFKEIFPFCINENNAASEKYLNSISDLITFECMEFPVKGRSEVTFDGCNGKHRTFNVQRQKVMKTEFQAEKETNIE